MVTVKRRKQKVSDNSNPKVSRMSSRSTETSCPLRTHTGCQTDVNLTKEKLSIKTTTAFTQTVVKETCGIAVQTNSKVVRDASSQQSRVETREYGSQPVAMSTANGNTQTDVALDLQTTGTQMEYDRLYIHPLPTIEEEEWEVDVPATCRNISKKDVLDEAIKSMAELASLTNSFLNDVSTRSNSADMIGLGVQEAIIMIYKLT
ncbi:hypothetical protein EB796_015076 [Bugula neritina]|uniref:Uncharacterized protein n=1 Tax=Bugula neritina TaxID=10212 RepID=A0A7J7JMF4_BUGNE|nr:hypothetical protein EB796_015076 [Bugula neritina]